MQPTSPFRKSYHIDEGIEKIKNSDAVIGIRSVKDHPYFMMKCFKEDYFKPYLEIINRPLRRQEVPPLYVLNSALFISKIEYFILGVN